jgi:hypothetical protein
VHQELARALHPLIELMHAHIEQLGGPRLTDNLLRDRSQTQALKTAWALDLNRCWLLIGRIAPPLSLKSRNSSRYRNGSYHEPLNVSGVLQAIAVSQNPIEVDTYTPNITWGIFRSLSLIVFAKTPVLTGMSSEYFRYAVL